MSEGTPSSPLLLCRGKCLDSPTGMESVYKGEEEAQITYAHTQTKIIKEDIE